MRKIQYASSLCLVVVLALVLTSVGCTGPTPAPKPAPAPAPATKPAAKPAPAVTTAPPAAKPSPKPASPSPVAKPSFKWPDPLVIASLDVGASGYVIAGAILNEMRKEKIMGRQVSIGTEQARISLLAAGRAHLTPISLATVHPANEGAFDYADNAWGPQRLFTVVAGVPDGIVGFVSAKDANIKTWADAKGKRMAHITGYAASLLTGGAQLAFGGLTWKDVKIVEVPSFGAGGRAVIEGKADLGFGASDTAWAVELAASPRGAYHPPMPHNDAAGWKRAVSVAPYLLKGTATKGAGITEPVQSSTYGFAGLTVYETADTELVYQLTKTLNDLYPRYANVGLAVEQLAPNRQVLSLPVPYHPGAIRYYKEIGRWTAENQKNNDDVLARMEVLRGAWNKAIAQADEQKIKVGAFRAFWMKIRAESLKAAGLPVVYE